MALAFHFLVSTALCRRLPIGWAAMAVAMVAGLAGCATAQPEVELEPNQPVAIVVSHAPGWPLTVRVLNESVGNSSDDALAGLGAGALAGGAWGLTCGPLAALCVPLGAMLGAEVGLFAGLAIGTTAALPADKADPLREGVDRVLRSHDFRDLLDAKIIQAAAGRWNLNSDQPVATVDVELRDLYLSSTRDERIRCVIKVAVVVRVQDTKRPPSSKPRVYEYVSPYSSLAVWMDETVGLAEANLAAASQHLATQIVSGLARTGR